MQATGETFRAAVGLRLRSDVPVGTCLSGGIDSSSIVAVASRDFGARMKTFSVCHDDPRISEEHYIDEVAAYCRAESIKLRLRQEDALADFDQFLYHQDEPVFSLSQYGEFAVMRLARQHGVPVLLNGQGGDEALCGYRKYAYFFLQQLLQRASIVVRRRATWPTRCGTGIVSYFSSGKGVRYVPRWMSRRYDPMDRILRPNGPEPSSGGVEVADARRARTLARTSVGRSAILEPTGVAPLSGSKQHGPCDRGTRAHGRSRVPGTGTHTT